MKFITYSDKIVIIQLAMLLNFFIHSLIDYTCLYK